MIFPQRAVKFLSFFTLMTCVFLFSCTNSEPVITFGFIRLVLYQGENGPLEHFSFFIIPEDEDGIDNLEELYLYHDKEQLCWHIKSDEWVRSTHNGREWIGTRSIAAIDGTLPRGLFRAVLTNKGGESSERTFSYDGEIRFPFPELEIAGGYYTVNSRWPVNRFVCYDSSGNYINTVTLTSFSGSLSQLDISPSTRTVALWSEDESNFCSAFTDVVPVN